MTGCDLNPVSNDDKVDIELGDISSIEAGSTQHVTAKIDANVAITGIVIGIFNGEGEDVTTELFTVAKQNADLGTKKKIEIGNGKDMYINITPKTTVCNETYTLKITAMAGAVSSTKEDGFSVTGGTCGIVEEELTAKNVTVGNQSAAQGSALDVDEMVVYKSSEVNGNSVNQAAVDAWFGIVGGNATILAPASANDFAPITQDWSVKNATKFLKVTADFDNIKTQSAIDALWSGSGSATLQIANDDVIVVQTTEGIRLLLIVSASNTTTGSISITGKIK